jgi:putative acetyltransferase
MTHFDMNHEFAARQDERFEPLGQTLISPFISLSGLEFQIRPWQPDDRQQVAALIAQVLVEFGLSWEPKGADRDVLAVEACYLQLGGQFWVVEQQELIVGTAAFMPVQRSPRAAEIRKMYLLPQARGAGLGRYLLQLLEAEIAQSGFATIWIETVTVMQAAIRLYEAHGYQASTGVETQRCDRVYVKHLKPNLSPS